jgi:translation initiation factor 3 subunit G
MTEIINFKDLINIELCLNKPTLKERIREYNKNKNKQLYKNKNFNTVSLSDIGVSDIGVSNGVSDNDLEPKIEIIGDKKFITTYDTNDLGRTVKNVKEYKMEKRKIKIPKVISERRKWTKFGASSGLPPGPDEASTTKVCEDVFFEFTKRNKAIDDSEDREGGGSIKNIFSAVGGSGTAVICRYCGGNHWSMKCANKDAGGVGARGVGSGGVGSGGVGSGGGKSKYVPPSMRNGAEGTGGVEGIKRNREENTIRVSNISENATENDIRDLFKRYGYIKRLFYKNEKGFAFITYDTMRSCEEAVVEVHRHCYDYLVLSVEIAKSK